MFSVQRAFVIFVLGAALSLAAGSANAQQADGVRLSLEDAISQAEQRSPEVTFARHQVRDAEARRVGAGVVMPVNPRLSLDVRPLLRADPVKDLGYAGSVDFLTELGGAPSARVREARGFVDVAQAELRVHRLQARANVWAAYVRALIAEQRIRETRVSVEIAERVLNASRQRAEAGASGDIEQSLARSELAQLEATVNAAARDRELQVMAIRDALNLDATAPLLLSTPLTEPGPVAPADQLARRALGARADLEAIRRRIDLLVTVQDRLEREVFPRVGGYLGVDSSPLSPTFGIVGLSVELPVAQRNQGPIARTIAQRQGETERLELEARRIVRDVYASRAAYESRRDQLRILTEGALPTAERTLELVETGWRSGRFDIFRVTSAARDLARVRGLRLDSLEAAWMERIALDRVVGGLGA
jgi:outer membrane protein, heavy metal efflux system